jgi:hypothetical protein
MGDLRNKFRKEEERERIRAMQARLRPLRPLPEPLRCLWCDRTHYEVRTMYHIVDCPWIGGALWCDECLKIWGPPLGLDLETWEWRKSDK